MKHHFKTVNDNNKKSRTGRGRITWEYFDSLHEIFEDDKTVNPGPVLSSFQSCFPTTPSTSSLPLAHRCLSPQETPRTSMFPETFSPYNLSRSLPSTSHEPSTSFQNTCHSLRSSDIPEVATPSNLMSPTTTADPINRNTLNENTPKTRKRSEARGLQKYKLKMLELETRRVAVLERIEEQLRENNATQKRRNELFEQYAINR